MRQFRVTKPHMDDEIIEAAYVVFDGSWAIFFNGTKMSPVFQQAIQAPQMRVHDEGEVNPLPPDANVTPELRESLRSLQ